MQVSKDNQTFWLTWYSCVLLLAALVERWDSLIPPTVVHDVLQRGMATGAWRTVVDQGVRAGFYGHTPPTAGTGKHREEQFFKHMQYSSQFSQANRGFDWMEDLFPYRRRELGPPIRECRSNHCSFLSSQSHHSSGANIPVLRED